MTNEDILKAVDLKKSEKRKKAQSEALEAERIEALHAIGLTPDCRPIGGKGHPHYNKSKKIDKADFQSAIDACMAGTSRTEAYKLSGLSYPTFTKRIMELCDTGMLPAEYFTDNKPYIFTYNAPSRLVSIDKEVKRVKKAKGI